MKKYIILLFLFFCALTNRVSFGADTLSNLTQTSVESKTVYSPGTIVLMPDGGQAVIMEELENGDLLTDLDIVISPEGIIRSGTSVGKMVKPDPEFYASSLKGPEATIEVPATGKNIVKSPAARSENAVQQKSEKKISVPTTIVKTPAKPDPKAAGANPANRGNQKPEDRLTLAQLLPMTNIQTGKPQEPKTVPEAAETKTANPKTVLNKKENPPTTKVREEKPAKMEKPAQAAKEPQKSERPKARAKAGEELRIPQEAIKSGNLDFLEGCWQGTRPEYYSKRTIKECFCFGSGGKSGKRRIYDHGRMCIGGTRASLSGGGVLSVTSSGAACNDGERWGSAEMVCKNSGPKTPCSWIFRDANNGKQAYTIPFVRVDSCGR